MYFKVVLWFCWFEWRYFKYVLRKSFYEMKVLELLYSDMCFWNLLYVKQFRLKRIINLATLIVFVCPSFDLAVEEELPINMYMVMAVLVPIGVLIIAVVIVFFVFRHFQKQRPESQENQRVREELLPQEYGGIRVTQVGDSTLQVKETELAIRPNKINVLFLSLSCSRSNAATFIKFTIFKRGTTQI